MMWWAMWCAAVLAGSATSAAPASDSITPLDFSQIDPQAPDDEGGISFPAVPPMGGRYENNSPWLYLLAEMPRESQVKPIEYLRQRRGYNVISVNPAVEHLQRNVLSAHLERIAHRNRNFLNCVGKRDPWSTSECLVNNSN